MMQALSESELLQSLVDFCNFPITLEQLRQPTMNFMINVFERFMQDLPLNVDAMHMASWKSSDFTEHKELFDDILPITVFGKIVCQIMQVCGITDMSIKDIVEPKPKRTKKILNYLVVLWKYCTVKYCNFRLVEDQIQMDVNKREMLIEKINKVTKECEEKLALLNMEGVNKKDELLKKKYEYGKQFEAVEIRKVALNEEYYSLKTREADMRKNIGEIDVNIITEKEKLEELNNVILTSPNRFYDEIEKLKEKNKEEEVKIKDMVNKREEKEKHVEFCKQMSHELENISSSINQIKDTTDVFRQEASRIDPLQQRLEAKMQKMKKLEEQQKQYEEKMQVCEHKWAKEHLQGKKQIETLKEIIEMHQKDIDKETTIIKSNKKISSGINEQVDTILAQLLKIKNDHEECVQNFTKQVTVQKDAYKKFMQETKDDHDRTMKILKHMAEH